MKTRTDLLYEIMDRYWIELSEDDVEAIKEFMRVLRVPATEESVRNFLAAYLRLACGWSAEEADRIASSPRGRRLWEKKLAELM